MQAFYDSACRIRIMEPEGSGGRPIPPTLARARPPRFVPPEIRETDEMFKLGEEVFLEGVKKLEEYRVDEPNFIYRRSKMIIKKRLAVVEFMNGLELILKAVMILKGYSIYKTKMGKVFRLGDTVRDTIDEDKTIDIDQVVRFFRSSYPRLPFAGVNELRKLRNQIVHKGTGIGMKKRVYFENAIECLAGVYAAEHVNHRKFVKRIRAARF